MPRQKDPDQMSYVIVAGQEYEIDTPEQVAEARAAIAHNLDEDDAVLGYCNAAAVEPAAKVA